MTLRLDLGALPERLRVGTSSFSAADWRGGFYPEHLPAGEFLIEYARQLRTVEIDATWHVMPTPRMVKSWAQKVPETFVFALKVPKVITHDAYLESCDEEWEQFLHALEPLGARRGPVLLQFQYFAKRRDPEEYETGKDFRRRLEQFLKKKPQDLKAAVEIRNEKWIGPPLLDLLRQHGVVFTFTAYYTMPSASSLLARCDPLTGDFAYLRFLGNHREMDERVAHARERGERRGDWDSLIVDRSDEMRAWIPAIRDLLSRQKDVFVYFNNHYAGFAPGSIDVFLRLWREAHPRGGGGEER